MTEEEIKEINRYIKDICKARDELAFSLAEEIKDELLSVLQEKKREWQEEAYMKGYTDTEDEFNEMFKLKSDRP